MSSHSTDAGHCSPDLPSLPLHPSSHCSHPWAVGPPTKLKAALINALGPTAVCRPTSCMYDCTHNGVVRGETHSLHSRRRRRQMTYLALMFMQCSCISWPPNGPCTAGQIIMNSLAHASRQRRAYVGGIALPIRVRLGYRVPSGVLGALLFAVVRQPS